MRTRSTTASTGAIIAVLGYCGALVSITQTVALPLLPDLPAQLGTSPGNVSWVATSALLSGAVSNPVLGRLGDMYGKRPVMLGSLVALTLGSLLCALSTTILPLIIGRTMQGLGIAVIPLGMAVAKEVLPPERTSSGVALVSATLGIGGGIGLPMAGILLGVWGWHSVFYVSTAMALVGLVAAFAKLPEAGEHHHARFDVLGAVWLSAVLVALLLPLSQSATWGWLNPLPITLYVGGVVGGIGWYHYEKHPQRPLVDVELMSRRPMMLANGAGLLLGFGMFNNLYLAIVLLQMPSTVPHGFGTSVVLAGLVVLPGALAMMVMSPVSAWITDNYGGRTSLWIGAVIIGAGFASRPWLVGSLFAVGLGVTVVNCGVGIAYGALPSVVMAFVPDSELASANAIGTLTRATGASLSSAAVAAILTSMTVVANGKTVPSLAAFRLAFALSAVAAFGAAALASRLPAFERPIIADLTASAPRPPTGAIGEPVTDAGA